MKKSKVCISLEDINKSYDSDPALKDINLEFEENKIYGLFGRNGAGKTTLLNIIANKIFYDSGYVRILNEDIGKNSEIISNNLCYMQEKNYFPERHKIKTLLSMCKVSYKNYDKEYARELCEKFEIDINKKYGQLSSGNKSIIKIVIGLASRAKITIFDEPVLGLDAVAREIFYSELIEEYTRNQRVFIISTHLIEESADLFNEAIIIKRGEIIKKGEVENLLENAFYVSGKKEFVDRFIKDKKVISDQRINDYKTAVIEGSMATYDVEAGLEFSRLTIQKLFVHLTKEESEYEKNIGKY